MTIFSNIFGGGRQEAQPAQAKVDPSQQPFLQDIREQAQGLFQLGAPAEADVEAGITAAITPVERRFTESILPQLTSAAEQAGAYGGSALPQQRVRAGREFTTEAARLAQTLRPELLRQALLQQWAPLSHYASIVGAPTVLSTGAQAPQPSTLSQMLSGGVGAGLLAKSLGVTDPWGIGAAALGGGLAGTS